MGASQSEPDAPNAAPEKEPALPPPPPPRKGLLERGAHKVHKRGAAAYAASPSASEAGGAAWKGLVNLTDSSSPLSVRTSPLPLKLCMMVTLFCAFSGAFIYMALNNTEYCNEENGCRVCSILDVESVKAADYEDDMKWELGLRTQQLTTSCAEVTLNPANEEAINKIALSEAELATIKDDLYQMNRLFEANPCGYYMDCNHAAWKTCDGGSGTSAYVFDAAETDEKETREVLDTIFEKLEGQLRVLGHLKYEKESRIWSGIDVGFHRMNERMEFDGVKRGLEAVAIKEALAMSCILRSLWVVSGRIYVMMKINTFFGHNSCERFDDGIRVSEELVRKVTDVFKAEGRDIHTNLIEKMIENFYETVDDATGARCKDVFESFTAAKFSETIDAPTVKTTGVEEYVCQNCYAPVCPDGSAATCCDVDGDCADGDDDYCCGGSFFCSNDSAEYAAGEGGVLCCAAARRLQSGGDQCTNTCTYANDGWCDDGESGSAFSVCPCGSDCADCGTRTTCTATDASGNAAAAYDDAYYYDDGYYYGQAPGETAALGDLPPLFHGYRVPDNYCSVYGTSEVRPFAIGKLSVPRETEGGIGCFDYTGSHLSFSTALLPVAPCGYPAGEGIEMQNSGIYGTADSPGFSTYVALGVNVQDGLKLTDDNLEMCSAYSNSSRLELRPVKNVRQSCTPWTNIYYEGDADGNPGGLAKLHDDDQCTDTCQYSNDGECDDGEDGAEQYCACGTDCGDCGARTCSNVVRHHETLNDDTFIEPPNTGFHSDAQICGKYQQLSSSPDVASGLWKVCSETGEIDVLANSYAFGALVLTVISLVAAFTVKLLFPSVPMDEGVGDLLLQTMELSERAGVSVPPALAQRTPRFQKMHFPGGSGNSEMDEALRSRAEAATADAAGQGRDAAADHLNDAYGDGEDPEDPEDPADD